MSLIRARRLFGIDSEQVSVSMASVGLGELLLRLGEEVALEDRDREGSARVSVLMSSEKAETSRMLAVATMGRRDGGRARPGLVPHRRAFGTFYLERTIQSVTALSFPSDAADWHAAVGGDADAFARVFDVSKDRVFRQALRHCDSIHDAEDITALVFFEAWRSRTRVRVIEGSIIPWLLVTTKNIASNQSRARRRHQAAMSRLPPAEPTRDHAEGVLDREEVEKVQRDVRTAFDQLTPRDRDVLILCVLEELTLQQVAAALRVPVGTVKSRLSRAKRTLGRLIEQQSTGSPNDQSEGAIA